VSKANPMHATAQMSHSIGVRTETICSVDVDGDTYSLRKTLHFSYPGVVFDRKRLYAAGNVSNIGFHCQPAVRS